MKFLCNKDSLQPPNTPTTAALEEFESKHSLSHSGLIPL